MESNFNNKDFEQFVKQHADQYRMFPSEKVWKGIDSALHTKRKWYGLGLALLLLLTGGTVTWVMMTTPVNKNDQQQVAANSNTKARQATTSGNNTEVNLPDGPIVYDIKPPVAKPVYNYPLKISDESINNQVAVVENLTPVTPESAKVIVITPVAENKNYLHLSPEVDGVVAGSAAETPEYFPVTIVESAALPINEIQENKTAGKEAIVVATPEPYSLTIESILNSYKKPVTRKKLLALQVYVSPTVSYRKLSENKEFLRSAANSGNVPFSVASRDVNNAVMHKPDMGMEVGVALKYALNKSFYLKAGTQFNINRYDIRAFDYSGEVATIALDDGSRSNSIRKQTIYRNFSGNHTNWLQNLYYSVAIPVGAEFQFKGRSSNTSFGIGATAQPTYVISDRAYLLSTDYKNYVEVPSLIRRWNFNTGLEAFVKYSTGRKQWQIGPQVRYQVRSSFQDKYPLKENLFDFGLKIGLTFNQ